jgi:hypothetical protein
MSAAMYGLNAALFSGHRLDERGGRAYVHACEQLCMDLMQHYQVDAWMGGEGLRAHMSAAMDVPSAALFSGHRLDQRGGRAHRLRSGWYPKISMEGSV